MIRTPSTARYSSAIDVGDRAHDSTLDALPYPELSDIVRAYRTPAHLYGSPPDPVVQSTDIRGIAQIEIAEGHHS
jgi:hypothetical protein